MAVCWCGVVWFGLRTQQRGGRGEEGREKGRGKKGGGEELHQEEM